MAQECMQETEWLNSARPFMDAESFLLTIDFQIRKPPFPVVFFLEGYNAQQKNMELSQEEPKYTSFAMRYHREIGGQRLLPYKPNEEPKQSIIAAAQPCFVVGLEFMNDSKHGKFARVTLERATAAEASAAAEAVDFNGTASSWSSSGQPTFTVDTFVCSGEAEFILAWQRWETCPRWKPGQQFQMFYRRTDDPEIGDWFVGRVVAVAPREPGEDDFRFEKSPWEEVLAEWEGEEEMTRVSPWEMAYGPRGPPGRTPAAQAATRTRVNPSAPRPQADTTQTVGTATSSRARHRYGDEFIDIDCLEDSDWDESSDSQWSEDEDHTRRRRQNRRRRRFQNADGSTYTCSSKANRCTTKKRWNLPYCDGCGEPANPGQGGGLLRCDGSCLRSVHLSCLPSDHWPTDLDQSKYPTMLPEHDDLEWICPDCSAQTSVCASCREEGTIDVDLVKCKMGSCGNYYHLECVKAFPSTVFKKDSTSFNCPTHYCHGCAMSGDALHMVKCGHCILAWHVHCIPASAVKLDAKYVVCGDCDIAERPPSGVGMGTLGAASATRAVQRKVFPMATILASSMDLASTSAERIPLWGGRIYDIRKEEVEAATLRAAGASTSGVVHAPKNVTDLFSKQIFFFGPHNKGGGCDWYVPTPGVKLHTQLQLDTTDAQLRVLRRTGNEDCIVKVASRVLLNSIHPGKSHVDALEINRIPVTNRDGHALANGDIISIGTRHFRYEFDESDLLTAPVNSETAASISSRARAQYTSTLRAAGKAPLPNEHAPIEHNSPAMASAASTSHKHPRLDPLNSTPMPTQPSSAPNPVSNSLPMAKSCIPDVPSVTRSSVPVPQLSCARPSVPPGSAAGTTCISSATSQLPESATPLHTFNEFPTAIGDFQSNQASDPSTHAPRFRIRIRAPADPPASVASPLSQSPDIATSPQKQPNRDPSAASAEGTTHAHRASQPSPAQQHQHAMATLEDGSCPQGSGLPGHQVARESAGYKEVRRDNDLKIMLKAPATLHSIPPAPAAAHSGSLTETSSHADGGSLKIHVKPSVCPPTSAPTTLMHSSEPGPWTTISSRADGNGQSTLIRLKRARSGGTDTSIPVSPRHLEENSNNRREPVEVTIGYNEPNPKHSLATGTDKEMVHERNTRRGQYGAANVGHIGSSVQSPADSQSSGGAGGPRLEVKPDESASEHSVIEISSSSESQQVSSDSLEIVSDGESLRKPTCIRVKCGSTKYMRLVDNN